MEINLSPVTKVTITTSVVEMWKNAVENLSNLALTGSGINALDLFKEVGLALLGDEGPDNNLILKSFRDGNTFILLNSEALEAIGPPNILREILITDKEGKVFLTVYHEDINF